MGLVYQMLAAKPMDAETADAAWTAVLQVIEGEQPGNDECISDGVLRDTFKDGWEDDDEGTA